MPKTTVSVISAVVWRLKTDFLYYFFFKGKKERRKEKLQHWLKQKLKRLKVTGIRKKNRRNVQKKITDAKGFGGVQTKKEKKEKRKRKKEPERLAETKTDRQRGLFFLTHTKI